MEKTLNIHDARKRQVKANRSEDGLVNGQIYNVSHINVHNSHTEVYLEENEEDRYGINSVYFDELDDYVAPELPKPQDLEDKFVILKHQGSLPKSITFFDGYAKFGHIKLSDYKSTLKMLKDGEFFIIGGKNANAPINGTAYDDQTVCYIAKKDNVYSVYEVWLSAYTSLQVKMPTSRVRRFTAFLSNLF